MNVRRSFRLASLMLIAAAAIASGACASTRTINELLADPGHYRNRSVKLSGEVVDSFSIANRGAYRIDDGTGQLWIVSEKGVPRRTARVTVKGKVREGFNLGSLGDALKLPPGVAAGMVLLESSHKAKRQAVLAVVAGPYRTVSAEARCEIAKIKGSRFIATTGPYHDEATLAAVIARLSDEFPDANHHCYAWRLGDRFRYNDDGEPSGTAGRPILQRIDGRGLDRTYVVVTRIFGGTKLGAGGLVRAYSAAAGAVLDAAHVVEVVPTTRIQVIVPYELKGAVESVVASHGVTLIDAVFAEAVTQTFAVPTDQLDELVTALRERTAGRAGIERLD